jgi:hypothetical protein
MWLVKKNFKAVSYVLLLYVSAKVQVSKGGIRTGEHNVFSAPLYFKYIQLLQTDWTNMLTILNRLTTLNVIFIPLAYYTWLEDSWQHLYIKKWSCVFLQLCKLKCDLRAFTKNTRMFVSNIVSIFPWWFISYRKFTV